MNRSRIATFVQTDGSWKHVFSSNFSSWPTDLDESFCTAQGRFTIGERTAVPLADSSAEIEGVLPASFQLCHCLFRRTPPLTHVEIWTMVLNFIFIMSHLSSVLSTFPIAYYTLRSADRFLKLDIIFVIILRSIFAGVELSDTECNERGLKRLKQSILSAISWVQQQPQVQNTEHGTVYVRGLIWKWNLR